jgi:hypothetical protein
MAKKRREKTLADYVVIAISPVLIMTLVGSLAFFLLELSYHGQFEIRLKWILFCFVSASVLVARIAIEQGKEHASLFGFALVGVVGFAAMRLVDNFLVAWVLLAVSWCCTWKLTWDCTLIDDDEDASGEGLLQAAGLNSERGALREPSIAGGESRGRKTGPSAGEAEARDASPDEDSRVRKRRAHAPGRWVVYFSLAALPLFGAGQLLIPARDTAGRNYAFSLLAVYVASGLGLLLTTSFLGLRRYLRQRKLQMPAAMTGTWLGMGTALAVVLLCLALLLPQPQGEYTLTALVDKVDAKIREASRFAVVPGDRAEGQGRRVGEQDQKAGQAGDARQPDQNPADQNAQAQAGQADGQRNPAHQNQNGGQKQDAGQKQNGGDGKGEARGDARGQNNSRDNNEAKNNGQNAGNRQKPGDQNQNQNQAAQNRPPGDQRQAAARPPQEQQGGGKSPTPPSSNSSGSAVTSFLQSLAPYFKWLVYGVLALVGIYFVIRHWSRFAEILAQMWAELLSLFGFRREQDGGAATEDDKLPTVAVRPFAAYEDPFFSGAARRMSPAQLVRYSFDALEAWARERVVARPPEQTPLEFAQELGRRVPALAKDVNATAELYVRVAYARKNPSREAVEVLERLWRRMGMGTGTEM